MKTIDELLQTAFDDAAAAAPHNPDLASTVLRRSRHRRLATLAPVGAALAVIAVVVGVVLGRPAPVDPASPGTSACAPLTTAVLPTWARSGFSDPTPSATYITSDERQIVAILFGPLQAPPGPDTGNKILWVTPDPAAGETLVISGRLEGGTATMRTTVEGGPGPSGIDVPVAGCWLFDLTWGTHRDSIAIPYAKP